MVAATMAPVMVLAATSPTYSAQLSWAIPTQRDNGVALTSAELSGYEVYYTSDDSTRTGTISVPGGTSASTTVPNLAAGKYYFTIAAVDRAGLKSQLSNMVESQVGTSGSGGVSNAIYSFTYTWSAPTKRTNGKSLPASQIAGYELSYSGGTPSTSKVVRVKNNPRLYLATCLAPGNYQFTVAALDASGVKISNPKSSSTVVKGPTIKKGVAVPGTGNPTSSGCVSEGTAAGGSTGSGTTGGAGGGSTAPSGSGGTTTTGSGDGSSSSGTSGSGTTGSGTAGSGAGTTGSGSTGSGTGTTGSGTTGGAGTVTPPVSYAAQLSWDIPSQRENGQPLLMSELAGYEIYYTSDNPDAVSGTIKVDGGSITKASLPSLPAGRYYFSISAIDTAGTKSKLSAVAWVRFAP